MPSEQTTSEPCGKRHKKGHVTEFIHLGHRALSARSSMTIRMNKRINEWKRRLESENGNNRQFVEIKIFLG